MFLWMKMFALNSAIRLGTSNTRRLCTTLVVHGKPILPIVKQCRFAVVELPGAQYKVTNDDLLTVDKVKDNKGIPVQVGEILTFDKVLLVGTKGLTMIGRPYVAGATVTALVEEQTQDAKVLVFKRRRRKHSQTMQGHRRKLTLLRIKGKSSFLSRPVTQKCNLLQISPA